MSKDSRQEVLDLIERASYELGETPDGVAAAEEAVRLADALEDAELGYEAREALMQNAAFSGYPDKLLVAFSWCLAKADKEAQEQPESSRSDFRMMSLLWRYKWVIGNAVDFPGISRSRILAMIEDFRTRALQAGFNERAALDLRFTVERRMGHLDAAREWFERWQFTERDGLADCLACELNGVVSFHADCGRYADAIQAASPILRGRMSCAEIPHKTHANLLKALCHLSREEEAARSHVTGYRLVRNNRAFIREHAFHLGYLIHVGNLEKALVLLRKHLPWALETSSGEDRFRFLVAARSLFFVLNENGTKSIRIRLPEKLCPVAGKSTARVTEMQRWVEPLVHDLANQFDTRNESHWFKAQLEPSAGPSSNAA
jgi:hypothetical protein